MPKPTETTTTNAPPFTAREHTTYLGTREWRVAFCDTYVNGISCVQNEMRVDAFPNGTRIQPTEEPGSESAQSQH